MLNVADLDLIDQARRRCDRLVVGVHSDELVLATLGRRPVVPLVERVALLRRVRGVDEVVVHGAGPVDEGLRRFGVVTDPSSAGPDDLVVRRASRSTALVAALAPVSQESVA